MKCTNCGAETVFDEEGICMLCSKPGDPSNTAGVSPSVDIEANSSIAQNVIEGIPPIPPKPEERTGPRLHKYYLENLEDIIRDFQSRGKAYTMRRWGMIWLTLMGLIEEHERQEKKSLQPLWKNKVPSKEDAPAQGNTPTEEKPQSYTDNVIHDGHLQVTITGEDFVGLDDQDFDLLWTVLGQVIQRRAQKGTAS